MNSWSEYPEWVHQLKWFLDDTVIDFLREGGVDDDPSDRVTAAALAQVCQEYGHMVEDDQCMISAHRYCGVCNRPMPYVPIGHYGGEVTVVP